ncbi:MAG: hypothetical protein EOO27_13615 [Comamonadaceae bacterium]|nr:MAG: hypothetical protein EOO27_13615 [Comamonadaceae bacterium]
MLHLAIHAAIAIVGLLMPNRAVEFARRLVRQIALARVQQRWIAMSRTECCDNSQYSEAAYESPLVCRSRKSRLS